MPEKQQHIAVIRLSAMGDVAMTVPVLRALSQQYPQVKITVISRPFFEPLFQDIPNLSFYPFDAKGRHKGFLGLLRLCRELIPLQIDALADLHNVLRSKIVRNVLLLTGKKVAYTDKGRADKKALTRLEKKTIEPLVSVFERHAKVFQKLGFPIDLSQPVFPERHTWDHSVLNLIGNENRILIGIAPFAQYSSKVYPPELMREVVQELSKDKNRLLLFFGSKEEKKSLQRLSKNIDNAKVVAGELSFSQELQLISHLRLMLSMDSGNAHLAALYGVDVVTLWGATHPYAGFAPFHQPLENCLLADRNRFPFLPTSVYGNKKVAGYEEAMRTIPPQSVVIKIKHLLEKKSE